jgi:hypothetical protein
MSKANWRFVLGCEVDAPIVRREAGMNDAALFEPPTSDDEEYQRGYRMGEKIREPKRASDTERRRT